MQVSSLNIKYNENEAHVVRRLGLSLVYHWDKLPDNLKGILLEQAVFTHDEVHTVQLKEQISSFIGRKKESPDA